MTKPSPVVYAERIGKSIYMIRGQRIMLSTSLAELYGVEPRVLMQAVKRNMERFPVDFMFQLSTEEFQNLKSQIVISSWGGARRARPYAFTEQGVAMLSSVLRSARAVRVNVEIMRAFVRLSGAARGSPPTAASRPPRGGSLARQSSPHRSVGSPGQSVR
jgi:hypothetical protein